MRPKFLTFVLIASIFLNLLLVMTHFLLYRMPKDSIETLVDDPKPIRALLDRQAADWNRGDLDAFLEGYWKSPKLVFQSGGDLTEGFENVRDRYRKRYLGKKETMGTLTFSELHIEPMGLRSAFVRGKFRLDFQGRPPAEGRFTLILRQVKGEWKIFYDHTSSAS